MIWNQYENFSPSFLAKHHDLVLYDVFHHIKALLLFPPNCSCGKSCRCSEGREKITLALNTNVYNKASRIYERPDRLYAMKALWYLPEDHVYRDLYPESYSVEAIEKELKERENNHFKMIDQLVWTFLRLGQTYKVCLGIPKASMSEALEIIVGETPLNTKVVALKKVEHLGGEKEYEKQFKHYKSVCHFIAALDLWKKEVPDWKKLFSALYPPLEQIERFLSLAHWFRKELLLLERPNVKDKVFLLEKDLCPLPTWIQSDYIDFSIEPFEEKVQEMWANARIIDPKTKTSTPLFIN